MWPVGRGTVGNGASEAARQRRDTCLQRPPPAHLLAEALHVAIERHGVGGDVLLAGADALGKGKGQGAQREPGTAGVPAPNLVWSSGGGKRRLPPIQPAPHTWK